MILSYKRDMTHNYMIPEMEEALTGNDYQIHMLMENHVEGLLPCSIKKINGKSRYFYDITSRQSMESVYEKEYLREKELRILFQGLYKALLEVKRFLLNTDKVVLEPEVIYMDIETKIPLFTYLPSFSGNILSSFQQFAARLLQMLDQKDKAAVLLGYEVYRKSMEANYSLEKLLEEVAFGGGTQWVQKKEESIPAEQILEIKIPEPVEYRQEDTGQDISCKRKKPKRKFPHVEKRTIFFLGVIFAAVSGIGFAAWFWNLNVTQLGGIAFFLASLLAWGISADGKKKKKKTVQLQKTEPVRKQEVPKKVETKWTEEEKEGTINVGATVLLSTGEEYVPHLSLISMNPRERNSVVLLNDVYTVGKLKNKVDIYIDHPSISRIHAKVCKEGKEYYLYDLNSTNGTFVNGRQLTVNEKVQIQLSDEIRFADLGYYVGKC